MKTAFARWLAQSEMTPFAFHKHTGLAFLSVRRLAGIGTTRRPERYFRTELLSRVSEITGIAMEVLVRDAEAARADPTPARKYERKGGGNVAAE